MVPGERDHRRYDVTRCSAQVPSLGAESAGLVSIFTKLLRVLSDQSVLSPFEYLTC